jgi:oligoendopeptidase F
MTTSLYPDPAAFHAGMPVMLKKLGWSQERAVYMADKIVVDPARGSGHAWGAAKKGSLSHLRTRISGEGMDYKGYNIAVHEFGHNVEQTISLYNVDNYMMSGVPNTAFTEANAFIFQSRDLFLLGMKDDNPDKEKMEALDAAWSLMEIMGVGMVDMKVWKWLYENPDATPAQLKKSTISIALDVWNNYFTPVLGIKDSPILAIYSHMIDSPLYLANYSYGQIIQFQIEEYLKGKNFSKEIDRIYSQGRLTPQQWMMGAVGTKISTQPILNALDRALK